MKKQIKWKVRVKAICLVVSVLSTLLLPVQAEYEDVEINFAKALQLSLYFFDANKCGPGISGGRLEWRGDCHVEDTEVPLKPMGKGFIGTNMSQAFIDKHRATLDPDGNGTLDLRGGMHDAGDHVKFGLPQVYAASTVGWGFYEFRDAYFDTGEGEHVIDILKWFNDYLLRSTFRDKNGDVVAFCYQVGEGNIDHNYWNPPELQRFERPAYFASEENPASDQCAGAAASLAIHYLNFKDEEPEYAKECLDTAIALYEFAKKYRGLGYSGGFYGSGYDYDEMAWAAVWLNIATGVEQYITDIVEVNDKGEYVGYFQRIMTNTQDMWQNIWVHCWDTVWGGVFAKLAPITNTERDWYIFRWNLEYWSGIPHANSGDTAYLSKSPAGFTVVNPYGSARYNTAAQLCALVYTKYKGATDVSEWAKGQMEYIMGKNPMDRPYIVGYSPKSAKHPHHRAAHGSKTLNMDVPKDHVHTLWGALVGGPDLEDYHKDETSDYVYNEVAIDYNSGFVGACAGLYSLYGKKLGHKPMPNFPPKEDPIDEYFIEAKLEQENIERTQLTVKIHNESAKPPHYENEIKARYYFNITELLEADQTIEDIDIQIMYDENKASYGGEIKVTGPVKWDDGGTYYVELDWSGYEIYAKREFQFAIVTGQDKNYKSHWDHTNDYSRQGMTKEDFAKTQYIPMYLGDKLVYGKEPEVIKPSPTPTRNPNSTPEPVVPPSLQVLYKCGEKDPSTNTIRTNVAIKNTGTKAINLSDVKLRYWFTKDSDEAPELAFDYVRVGVSNLVAKLGTVEKPVSVADSYVEIGFGENAGLLPAGADTGDIQFKISKTGYALYDQSNDYSFVSSVSKDFAENKKITAYVKSALSFGSEPEGIGPMPTPTPNPPKYIPGDINGDKEVDSTDFALLKRYLLNIVKEFSSEEAKLAADVNGDGQIDSTDFALLKRYLLGIIKTLPVK